jgi:hypothetical protein
MAAVFAKRLGMVSGLFASWVWRSQIMMSRAASAGTD